MEQIKSSKMKYDGIMIWHTLTDMISPQEFEEMIQLTICLQEHPKELIGAKIIDENEQQNNIIRAFSL